MAGAFSFCSECGTALFYDAIQPDAQIQLAERVGWMERLDAMPKFDRYPGR